MGGPRCDFQMLGQQTGSKIGSPSCCNQVRRRWNHLLPDSCTWCFWLIVLKNDGGFGLFISGSSVRHTAVKGQHGIDVIEIQIVTDGMRLNKCWWHWRSKRGVLWPCCYPPPPTPSIISAELCKHPEEMLSIFISVLRCSYMTQQGHTGRDESPSLRVSLEPLLGGSRVEKEHEWVVTVEESCLFSGRSIEHAEGDGEQQEPQACPESA